MLTYSKWSGLLTRNLIMFLNFFFVYLTVSSTILSKNQFIFRIDQWQLQYNGIKENNETKKVHSKELFALGTWLVFEKPRTEISCDQTNLTY